MNFLLAIPVLPILLAPSGNSLCSSSACPSSLSTLQIRARGLRLLPVTAGYLLLASLLAPALGWRWRHREPLTIRQE
eukprot:322967-Hanusia_phi.AAC.1